MASTRPALAGRAAFGIPPLEHRYPGARPLPLRCWVPHVRVPGLDFHLLSVGHAGRTGGPGRLPSQGSHRSGRAELPHPARQDTALLRGEPVHNARSRERESLQQRAHAMPVYVSGVGAA